MSSVNEPRSFPQFTDTSEWNPVTRETLQAQQLPDGDYLPIPDRTLFVESHVLMIGCRNPQAGPNWFLACRASQLLSFLPSSTSQFVAAVQSDQKIVRLDTLNLIVFPKLMSGYLLQLKFPIWHQEMYLEVWSHSGADVGVFDEVASIKTDLARLETKVDNLQP